MSGYLSAADAAQRLGIGRATLYAYVSRGLLRSRQVPGSRRHEYLAADIEAMLRKRDARRDPTATAAQALDVHGLPVLRSSLTLIRDGKLHYRGHDAIELARTSTLEDVAALLWEAPLPRVDPYVPAAALRNAWRSLPCVNAMQAYVAQAGPFDVPAYSLQPDAVRMAGARLLRGLAGVAAGSWPPAATVSETLMAGWAPKRGGAQRRIEAALVLAADHELNVSTFTARCIASAGATPYMVVMGGLAAMQGHRHGGHMERVADLFDEPGDPRDVLASRMRRGDDIPGVGHPLYPQGDPRTQALLANALPGRARDRARAFEAMLHEWLGARASFDFGLLTLCRSLGLPDHASFAVFVLGRVTGWIGHALEQYAAGTMIRPRAEYVGPEPRAAEARARRSGCPTNDASGSSGSTLPTEVDGYPTRRSLPRTKV